jgi:cobaltochelatase CobN
MCRKTSRSLIVLAWLSALLVAGVAPPASAAEPIRVLVIANTAQLLPQGYEAFRAVYGNDLIDLEIASDSVEPERLRGRDVIVAYFLTAFNEQRLATEAIAARRRGTLMLVAPADAGRRNWELPANPSLNNPVVQYWDQGGVENMAGFLAYVYSVAGGTRQVLVPPAVSQVERGIYHPRAPAPFASLGEYLEWYRTQSFVPARAPLVGLTFFSTSWKSHDLEHIDAFIAAFERRGIGVVPAFDWPLGAMEPLLALDGRSPLRVLFVLNQSMAARSEDPVLLQKLGVHTINLMATRQSREEWESDVRGLPLDRVRNTLELPESAGASEPVLFSTFEPVGTSGARVNRVVPERLDALVARTARWIALQDKANRDKRVAFIYYNNPPGKGNVGASYLAVYPTLVNLLKRLQQEGYSTGTYVPDERRLTELLERSGRNIELWSPGELRDMVSGGGLQLVSVAQYKTWFSELPARYRAATVARWGRPEDATLMTVRGEDGQKYFVIPGVRVGNLFLGPQPLRQTFEEAASTAHDPETPVPHQYVAAYLWYRHEFKADAVVHVGRHGTLEWLPGKQTAQAGWDASEVLLGDLPNPYIYIMDGGGEAIQAKRRGAAVIIGHLTPMIVDGGALPELEALHAALENLDKVEGNSADLVREYTETARSEIVRLKLDSQLGFALDGVPWDEVERRVHKFLHDTENNTVPLGMHVVGEAPPETNQREGLAAFIKYTFDESEVALLQREIPGWADTIFEGKRPDVPRDYSEALREKIDRALDEAAEWILHLRESPPRELDGLVTVLAGKYLPSGPLGDPLRVPAALPTGRNEHASDGSLIPTRAAWNVGRRMADEFIAKYRIEHGEFPDKISLVLWYGETSRHQGALEGMALYLMGVEPIWNARGVPDNLRLIPDRDLGRPRVDVLFTISGIYRDGFPDKVFLLDRAVRLAAAAGDNAISRHDREVAASLQESGVSAELAGQIARARVFGNKPSSYGVGVGAIVEQSKDADGHTDDLGNVYLHNMNFAFSSEVWGIGAQGGLATHLKGNQAVVFGRANNLNGALDNDDLFQYFGGLSVASKTVNRVAPDMYVGNFRKQGQESLSGLQDWLAAELNARNWNPKWITEMQRSGYAGAREMAREMEHLYGFQATSAEQVSGTFWQTSFDVFVADKYGLEMDRFFKTANPYAQQSILARMLEVDRQGSYRFSDADRATLVQKYVESVSQFGVSCTANTCGNLKVHQYIGTEAALHPGLGQQQLRQFGLRVARATGWTAEDFAAAAPAMRAGVQAAAPPPPPIPAPASPQTSNDVTGFKIEETIRRLAAPVATPVSPWVFVVFVLTMAFGMLMESRRRMSPTV